jgi:hypothetical protein
VWFPKSQTLNIGLSARRLVLARMGGIWPGKLVACDSLNVEQGTDAEPWRPAVNALGHLLAGIGGKKHVLHIVLSGRFVRWQLLPWRPELAKPKELAAYAGLRFRETFGKTAQDWRILHSPQPPGKTMPACAVDGALVEALRSICDVSGVRLATVTPYFGSAFDRWRNALKGDAVWFGLVEADSFTLGLLREKNWMSLRTQRLDGNLRDVLPGMMAQIGISADVHEASLPLYLAGDGEPPMLPEGLSFDWLLPKPQAQSAVAGCRLALGV